MFPQQISISRECLPGGPILGWGTKGEFLSFFPPIPGRANLRNACFHLQLWCHGWGKTCGGISVSARVESSREGRAAPWETRPPGLQLGIAGKPHL